MKIERKVKEKIGISSTRKANITSYVLHEDENSLFIQKIEGSKDEEKKKIIIRTRIAKMARRRCEKGERIRFGDN